MTGTVGLAALEARVAHDLETLCWSGGDFTAPRAHAEGHVYDVVIVGGGQSGLAAAFGLRRERVSNVLVIDENPAGYEGPWATYARMITLRTPKELTPLDYGIPSLTFRAWWEAQHGAAGWAAVDKIPRGDWMAYLRWYRRVLDLPVRNEAKLAAIEPVEPGLFRLHIAGAAPLLARKVVLATGIQGGGEWHTPDFIKALPRHLYAHTSEPVDLEALKGKRIGILGGGASAFDNANCLLEHGAGAVEVFIRRKELPRINPIRFMERVGLAARYPALDDDAKVRAIAAFLSHNQPPTNDTFNRAASRPGFALRLGEPWLEVAETAEGQVRVTTPLATHVFDFLLLSTGLISDPALRPELRLVADAIACWRDRAGGTGHALIDAHPDLGPAFEFRVKPGADPARIHGLFAFNYSALVSLGLSASALSGLRTALPRLCAGVADQLFLDDAEANLAAFIDYAEPEFLGQWPLPVQEAAA